jgi:hypothetical protein
MVEKKMTEEKTDTAIIPEKEANRQIELFMDYYDINLEVLSSELKTLPLKVSIEKIKKHIMNGLIEISVSVDGGVSVSQQLSKPIGGINAIEYKSLGSGSAMAIDGIEKAEEKKRALLGFLCGKGPLFIGKLEHKDYNVSEAIYSFLSVAQIG